MQLLPCGLMTITIQSSVCGVLITSLLSNQMPSFLFVVGESEWSILEAQEEMAVVVAEVEEEEVLHRLIG